MKKRLFYVLILLSFFDFDTANLSYAVTNNEINALTEDMRDYFLDYYAGADEGKTESEKDVLLDIKGIVSHDIKGAGLIKGFKGIDNFFRLTQWLNSRLNKEGLAINIFTALGSNIINCWMGEVQQDIVSSKEVWGREYGYRLMVFDRLIVRDYAYYISGGSEEFGFVSKGNFIFCNNDALDKKARERWDLLISRYKSRTRHAYNPYRSDRLRRKFLTMGWEAMFFKALGRGTRDEARRVFLKSAGEKLLETAVFHELGHMAADNDILPSGDDKDSEIIAMLTELAFGPLPYESLNTLLSFAWRGPWPAYRYAGQWILDDFIRKTEKRYHKDNPKAGVKGTMASSLLARQDILCFLSKSEVRELAKEEFDAMSYAIKIERGRI